MTADYRRKKRIVLIEDNPSDIFLLQRALDEHEIEYDVQVVKSGERALSYLDQVQRGGEPRPDLIVLDLNLPCYDGIEILDHCRGTAALEGVRVIVLTSSDSPDDHTRASRLGVSDYIKKPLLLDQFMAVGGRIKAVLDGSGRALAEGSGQ